MLMKYFENSGSSPFWYKTLFRGHIFFSHSALSYEYQVWSSSCRVVPLFVLIRLKCRDCSKKMLLSHSSWKSDPLYENFRKGLFININKYHNIYNLNDSPMFSWIMVNEETTFISSLCDYLCNSFKLRRLSKINV